MALRILFLLVCFGFIIQAVYNIIINLILIRMWFYYIIIITV